MGARGPRGQTPEVKKLKGNPGNRPIIEGGVKAGGTPFVADFLNDDEKEALAFAIRLMPPSHFAAIDGFALAQFIVWFTVFKAAKAAIDAQGLIVKGSVGQEIKSPHLAILNEASAKLMSFGDRLGFDPKSRMALIGSAEQDKPKSKFAGFLGADTPN